MTDIRVMNGDVPSRNLFLSGTVPHLFFLGSFRSRACNATEKAHGPSSFVCTMDDDAATLHRAVDEIRVAHAAALAALAAIELSKPPLPPRPPIRFGRLGDAVMGDVTTLQPYFVHGEADSLSPLFFTSGSLEHAFLTSHRGDSQDCLDDDTATPKELVLRKRAGCLHNVDGVYAALLYLARAPSGTSRCY